MTLLLLPLFLSAVADDRPLLYLPFDGNCRPLVARGPCTPTGGQLQFQPGIRSLAARLDGDCRLHAPDCMAIEAGTLAFWMRLVEPPSATGQRMLFCRYGDPAGGRVWQSSRFSLGLAKDQLHWDLYPAGGPPAVSLQAAIGDCQPGQWHHLALTWNRINSHRPDAELQLYVDGRRVAHRDGLRLDFGPMSPILDIGRDSDGSPDYALADIDELYIYARPLREQEISSAVSRARAKEPAREGDRVSAVSTRPTHADWWDARLPFRCPILIPPDQLAAGGEVRLPWDVDNDLHQLGISGQIDPATITVMPAGIAAQKAGTAPLPVRLEEDSLCWKASAQSPTDRHCFDVYFDVLRVDTRIALWAILQQAGRLPAAHASPPSSDYAQDTYGDAWDFNEGDFEGIDGWGNRDYGIQRKEVKDGVLRLDICRDPYFIWGDLWGSGAKTNRPVAIDLARYPVLILRVRQSCPSATWQIYARPQNASSLLRHEFIVKGTHWQTVRIDLLHDAQWAGTIAALRIDPTDRVEKAHVEIDFVRLVREVAAQRQPVEILPPWLRSLPTPGSSPLPPLPAVRELVLGPTPPSAPCGSHLPLDVKAHDEQGRPLAGVPLTIRLASGSGGRIEAAKAAPSLPVSETARRGLTDSSGQLRVNLQVSRRSGPRADVVEAVADFSTVAAVPRALNVQPGPPHHYRVWPEKAATVPASRFPMPITVQLVDEHGNSLPVAGKKVRLSGSEGCRLEALTVVTDADGKAASQLSAGFAQNLVFRVTAEDDAGLRGQSAAFSVALEQPRPRWIRQLPNGYFAWSDGQPFVPLGGFYANWVQDATPDGEWGRLQSFTDTTDEQKRQWMQFLEQSGVTAMRMMLRTHRPEGMEPMDVCGRVNQPLLAETVRYLDLARPFSLQFQLVLHEDYTKPVYFNRKHFDRYAAPAFSGESLDGLPPEQRRFVRDRRWIAPIGAKYTDPDVLACQDRYIAELLPALRNHPQVFAYELENEMVDCPASWAKHAIETIRRFDPRAIVGVSHGGGGLSTADPAWWCRETPIDFYNYHLYPHGTTSTEIDYGAAVAVLARYGRMAGNCFLGESAGDQFRLHPSVQTRRWVMRDIIWMSLCAGNPGVYFWNARGPEVREFRFARQALEGLDLLTFRRAPAGVGVDVRHALDGDKWYRSPPGQDAYALMGRYAQHYLSQGVDFDFTLNPERYQQVCTLDRFAPVSPARGPLRPGPGWQLAYLARDDGKALLAYCRNYAGQEVWESPMARSVWRQWLRQRKVAPLQIQTSLPGAAYEVTVFDLDLQSVSRRHLEGQQPINLGETDHDFALLFQRARSAASASR